MKAEIGKEVFYLTWRFIMAFLVSWTGRADRCAAGSAAHPVAHNFLEILAKLFLKASFKMALGVRVPAPAHGCAFWHPSRPVPCPNRPYKDHILPNPDAFRTHNDAYRTYYDPIRTHNSMNCSGSSQRKVHCAPCTVYCFMCKVKLTPIPQSW